MGSKERSPTRFTEPETVQRKLARAKQVLVPSSKKLKNMSSPSKRTFSRTLVSPDTLGR